MRVFTLKRSQKIDTSIGDAWAFFSDPGNLNEITPPSLGLKVTSDLTESMYAGMIVTYTVRPLLGVRMRWVTEITHVDPPHYFIDEQRFGPYKFWHHEHRFREVDGGVEATDTVHYGLSAGPLSGLLNWLVVSRQLTAIFQYRSEVLRRVFAR